MLKDKQYKVTEKELISKSYGYSIQNDKLFPGGQKILDFYFMNDIKTVEQLYRADSLSFKKYQQRLLKSVLQELRSHSNMDSLFATIKTAYSLDSNLQYLLTVNAIRIMFSDGHVAEFYNDHNHLDFISDSLQTEKGLNIAGKLNEPAEQNLVSRLTVSSPEDYNYSITFSLFADRNDRVNEIAKLMMPTILLSLTSIALVMLVYYITYRNWVRQRRLAEMKSDFVNSITHEFHTPISTIMVANKSLQNDRVLADKDRIKTLTDVIFRQSKRLQTLFGQVLDITKMQDVNLEKEEVVLPELLAEILDDYRLKLTDVSVHFSITNIDAEYRVSLNRFWFTTMLFNIFDNAIKYNEKDVKEIKLSIVVKQNELQVHIADNGIGMEEETVKYIFDKFYRANQKQMTHIHGLGLGLYYAQQCIRIHGWKLLVNSKINAGSEFIIFIPDKIYPIAQRDRLPL